MGAVTDAFARGEMLAGKYAVDRRLGAGGMGTVYAAEHLEIGRPVAIKVLSGALTGDPALVTRFRMEARAAALIKHPGIVDVLDVGTTDDGSPFIVMEMLEGETLGALLERGERLAPSRLIEIIAAALDALAAAHRAGIVHRDLKPDNLFICREGAAPAKLLDFGISKFAIADGLAATQTGVVMGTPLYMAPEQIRSAKDAGPAADLYAIGAICFHALTGRPPFGGDTFSEVVARVVTEPLPSLRAARPDLPAALVDLVERLLSKTPADRPADAASVAASFRAIEPSSPAQGPRAPSRAGRRVRGVAIFSALGIAALAIAGTIWRRHTAESGRQQAAPAAAPRAAAPIPITPSTPDPSARPPIGAGPPPARPAVQPASEQQPATAPRTKLRSAKAPAAPPSPKPPAETPRDQGLRLIGDNPYDSPRK
jgi:serine/threonine protein kinase